MIRRVYIISHMVKVDDRSVSNYMYENHLAMACLKNNIGSLLSELKSTKSQNSISIFMYKCKCMCVGGGGGGRLQNGRGAC